MIDIEQNLLSNLPEFIRGAEDDEPGDSGTTNPPTGDPGEGNEGNPEGEEGTNSEEGKDAEDGRTTALRKERKLKREAEAEAKRLQRENEQLKREKMDETERVKAEAADAIAERDSVTTKLQKMVEGYRSSAIKSAIEAEAKSQNFVDVSDATNYFAGVDVIELFGVEQDEEDPSQITLNKKAITSEIKKLATSKPHYISKGTDDGNPTGSPFGGSKRKPDADELETLRQRYPSL